MGGYEGADHVNAQGFALDMARMTAHDTRLDEDYRRAARLGIRTVRESVGWRLCEDASGNFDPTRIRLMAQAANRHGVQILWTLMHYGIPPDLSLLDDTLIERFAKFAGRVAEVLLPLTATAPVYTPVNEISFLAWAAVDTDMMGRHVERSPGREDEVAAIGYALKRRLVRASLAGIDAVRAIDPRARILHIEPVVHVVPPWDQAERKDEADRIAAYQWQALDLLTGKVEPELGGAAQTHDYIGVNHYHNSQWELGGNGRPDRKLEWHERDARRLGLSALLARTWKRYGVPLIVGETGHVGVGRAAWLHESMGEVGKAQAAGIPVDGLCLYPLLDRPDWGNPAQWHRSGLWHVPGESAVGAAAVPRMSRLLNQPYARALRAWQRHEARECEDVRPMLVLLPDACGEAMEAACAHLLSELGSSFDVVLVDRSGRVDRLRSYPLGPRAELVRVDDDPLRAALQLQALMSERPRRPSLAWAESAPGLEIARRLSLDLILPPSPFDGHPRTIRACAVVTASYEAEEAAMLLRGVPAGPVVALLEVAALDALTEFFLDVARRCPSTQFVIFSGHPTASDACRALGPNLHLRPHVHASVLPALMEHVSLCLTPAGLRTHDTFAAARSCSADTSIMGSPPRTPVSVSNSEA